MNCRAAFTSNKKAAKLYLGMLTVNPELQAKGIGKKLLSAAEEYGQAEKLCGCYHDRHLCSPRTHCLV
jgi:ribosomal protein S18 acetylase RimI-like enzyme